MNFIININIVLGIITNFFSNMKIFDNCFYIYTMSDLGLTKNYYKISQYNNTNSVIPLLFEKNLNQPILYNPSEWSVSITKFRLPFSCVPLFKFDNGFKLTMGYNDPYTNTEYTVTNPVPYYDIGNYGNPDISTLYVWNMSQFLIMINNTLDSLFTSLSNLLNSHSITLPTAFYPRYAYDTPTKTFHFAVPLKIDGIDTHWQTTQTDICLSIYFNELLYSKMSGFASIYNTNLPPNRLHQLIFTYSGLLNPNLEQNVYADMISPGISFEYMTDASTIVFLSSSVSSQLEYSQEGGGLNIIAEYSLLELLGPSDFSGYLEFNTIIPYRTLKLFSEAPLNRIDIGVYLLNKDGSSHRLSLPPYQAAEVKLMFLLTSESRY